MLSMVALKFRNDCDIIQIIDQTLSPLLRDARGDNRKGFDSASMAAVGALVALKASLWFGTAQRGLSSLEGLNAASIALFEFSLDTCSACMINWLGKGYITDLTIGRPPAHMSGLGVTIRVTFWNSVHLILPVSTFKIERSYLTVTQIPLTGFSGLSNYRKWNYSDLSLTEMPAGPSLMPHLSESEYQASILVLGHYAIAKSRLLIPNSSMIHNTSSDVRSHCRGLNNFHIHFAQTPLGGSTAPQTCKTLPVCLPLPRSKPSSLSSLACCLPELALPRCLSGSLRHCLP